MHQMKIQLDVAIHLIRCFLMKTVEGKEERDLGSQTS